MKRCFLSLIILITLISACNKNPIDPVLSEIETYIHHDPVRALNSLDSIDKNQLGSKKERAHFALIKSMALDKNYIDIASDSIIAPAVEYYSKHGNADEKMKSFFYWGVTLFNAQEYDNAALAYTLSEEFMDSSSDATQKGIIYLAIARLYRKINITNLQKLYLDKSIEQFLIAKDTNRYYSGLIEKGIYYQNMQEWEKADSLYRSLINKVKDNEALSDLLSNYARLNAILPTPKAQEAIDLYHKLYQLTGKALDLHQLGPYGYCLLFVGETEQGNYVINEYKKGLSLRSQKYDYWLYRIARLQEDYTEALEHLEQTTITENIYTRKLFASTVTQSLLDYRHDESIRHSQIAKRNGRLFFLAISITILSFFLFLYLSKKRKEANDRKLLAEQETIALLTNEKNEMDETQTKIRKEFIQLIKIRFEEMGEVLIQKQKNSPYKKDFKPNYNHSIQGLQKDEFIFQELIKLVNEELNNLIDLLLEKIPLTPKEVKYLCCFIIGLDLRIIVAIMDTTPNYVYKIKSSIKKKITDLNDPSIDIIETML